MTQATNDRRSAVSGPTVEQIDQEPMLKEVIKDPESRQHQLDLEEVARREAERESQILLEAKRGGT